MKILILASLLPLIELVVSAASTTPANSSKQCGTVSNVQRRRLFVLSDVGNEPDDQMSLVRLLTYSNEIDIQGIAAVTSTWLKNTTNPDTVKSVITAYGEVVDNLNANVQEPLTYPSAESLLAKVLSGRGVYGLAALSLNMSGAATSLVHAVDKGSSSDPLWIAGWGGANVLAEALNHVAQTRDATAAAEFVSKIRYHGASDQDNAAVWVRIHYPQLFFVSSIHGWGQYYEATWAGISGESVWLFDPDGPDSTLVANDWLQEHIRIGTLGAKYPNFTVIMEGDTPTFFPLIPNGLADPEHPEWGSWGGRYALVDPTGVSKLYSNAVDLANGTNGQYFTSSFASVWRWREEYQYDFAARMQWATNGNFKEHNHSPVPVVNNTCGPEPLVVPFDLLVGEAVVLDASGSWDPDNDELSFEWFNYQEDSMSDVSFERPGYTYWITVETLDERDAIVSAEPKTAVVSSCFQGVLDVS